MGAENYTNLTMSINGGFQQRSPFDPPIESYIIRIETGMLGN